VSSSSDLLRKTCVQKVRCLGRPRESREVKFLVWVPRGGPPQAGGLSNSSPSFSTRLMNGYDIRTVQDLLGHKRTAMIYAQVLHQERRGAQSPVDLL
jgi:hypothetical protein